MDTSRECWVLLNDEDDYDYKDVNKNIKLKKFI